MSCQAAVMRSKNPVEKYEFKWEIHNFSKFFDGVRSAVFVPCSIRSAGFYLEISYRMQNVVPECVFSLHYYSGVLPKTFRIQSTLNFQPLPCTDCQKSNFESARAIDGNIIQLVILSNYQKYPKPDCQPGSFFTTSQCNDLLVVHCHFEVSGHKITNSSVIPLPVSTRRDSYKLSSDMKILYYSKKFCDFTIQIGEKTLLAHKSILAVRSPVFESMMQNQFQESQVNCVNITDVDYNVFDCFLCYLYTGEINDKNFDTLCSLYALADKYAVSDLQIECGDELASCLTLDNAIAIAKLSFYHSDASLKEKAINFITDHFPDMYSRPDWRDLVKECPELSTDVLGRVASMLGTPKSNIN